MDLRLCLLRAVTMPTIVVTNKSDSMVQIMPIEGVHEAPAPLDQIREGEAMKIYRGFIMWAVVIFLAPILSFAGQSEIDYQVEQVKGLLKLPPGSSLSVSEKILNRLGDRVAIALMKIQTEQELVNPTKRKRYPTMIKE